MPQRAWRLFALKTCPQQAPGCVLQQRGMCTEGVELFCSSDLTATDSSRSSVVLAVSTRSASMSISDSISGLGVDTAIFAGILVALSILCKYGFRTDQMNVRSCGTEENTEKLRTMTPIEVWTPIHVSMAQW